MSRLAAIAADVRAGRVRARDLAVQAIARVRADPFVSVTRVFEDRALAEADAVDARVARGEDPGPLAGVPYGAKDLFDVAGHATTAGAKMREASAPAASDAEAIRRLNAAGAVLVASLNMDEYAYGFATINAHYGTTRNPHDPARLAGGSSGGSAAAVAGRLLPLSLGSDTNGSIRVPASLTGLFGLKPTHADLSVAGTFPFVESFDDIGPFAQSAEDLRLAWSVLKSDEASAERAEPRIARLGGWFRRNTDRELLSGIDAIAEAVGGAPIAELPQVETARSAAFVMTACEGGALHLPNLRTRAMDYDPATRDRLIAGALLPASYYLKAQDFRRKFAEAAARLFARYDVLIAPGAPVAAPLISDPVLVVDGHRVPARAHLGIMTQPLNFIGLPVIAAPLKRPGQLPLGIQIIGAPHTEATLFAFAQRLERMGLIGASRPAFAVLDPEDAAHLGQPFSGELTG